MKIELDQRLGRLPEQNRSAAMLGAAYADTPYRIIYQRKPSAEDFPIDSGFPDFNPMRVGHYNPLETRFAKDPKKDQEVKQMIGELYDACSQYMHPSELAKIDIALSMMNYGHQGQLRDDKETPYVEHVLHVTLPLAKKYEMDWETIASALLHDVLEDSEENGYPVTEGEIHRFLSPDVADTVTALSKVRFGTGKHRDEEKIDEATRAVLFESLSNNPRAAVIKIYDRLHNMKTISTIAEGASKRQEKAIETLKYYAPLAQFLGLYDEARKLAKYSLDVLDPVFTHQLEQTLEVFTSRMHERKEEGTSRMEKIRDQIASSTGIARSLIEVRVPDMYALYRSMGQKKDPKLEDCFLSIDIRLPKNISEDQWAEYAWNLRWPLSDPRFFESLSVVPLNVLRAQEMEGRLPSMEFYVAVKNYEVTKLKVNVFSYRTGGLVQVPITDLYLHRKPETDTPLLPLDFRTFSRNTIYGEQKIRNRGLWKWNYVRQRIEATRHIAPIDRIGSKFFDVVLPGKLQIESVDRNGRELWVLNEGATVIDYLIDRYPDPLDPNGQYWQHASFYSVNGEVVSPTYIVKPGDKIETQFSSSNRVHVSWIRSLKTSTIDKKEEIRAVFRERLLHPRTRNSAYQELRTEAVTVLEAAMGGQKLLINLEKVFPFMDLLNAKEFMLALALDEIEEKHIKNIAQAITRYQEKHIVQIFLRYAIDKPGLLAGVHKFIERKHANVRLSQGAASVFGAEDPAVITVFVDLGELYQDEGQFADIKILLEHDKDGVVKRLFRSKKCPDECEIFYPRWISVSEHHLKWRRNSVGEMVVVKDRS